MRSYAQHCGLAKALDVVGDRWTLLIVRELLILGGCRYTDLQKELGGIATNLLATRLKELEETGVVQREEAPPPAPAALFRLTQRGRDLEPVLAALGRWGAPLLKKRLRSEAFHPHWLALPMKLYLRDRAPERPPVRIQLRMGTESLVLETSGHGRVNTRMGLVDRPDATVSGAPEIILQMFTGAISIAEARGKGVRAEGDEAAVERLLPGERS